MVKNKNVYDVLPSTWLSPFENTHKGILIDYFEIIFLEMVFLLTMLGAVNIY